MVSWRTLQFDVKKRYAGRVITKKLQQGIDEKCGGVILAETVRGRVRETSVSRYNPTNMHTIFARFLIAHLISQIFVASHASTSVVFMCGANRSTAGVDRRKDLAVTPLLVGLHIWFPEGSQGWWDWMAGMLQNFLTCLCTRQLLLNMGSFSVFR